ncbi:MAG: F0F1 ATP synthase subunit B [Ignavibacteria bacterium]|nr:F0F1 ATP synthase subunit B [Ignavibacteria bacterium]MCC7158826.1 F0F1 ATP synthase subunit B [Ignavibacteria bacterium]
MTLAYLFLAKFYNVLLFISSDPHEKKDTLLSVEPGLLIWTIIIFFLLLLLLKKYAWGPLLKSLNEREQSIKDSVEKAEYLKQEAEKILAQNKALLAKADEDARKVIAEGKELAEKMRNEMISKTHDDTSRMISQAKSEIEREKIGALNTLKDEIANLAIQAAGKIIDENLDPAKQKKIIDGFINKIPQN